MPQPSLGYAFSPIARIWSRSPGAILISRGLGAIDVEAGGEVTVAAVGEDHDHDPRLQALADLGGPPQRRAAAVAAKDALGLGQAAGELDGVLGLDVDQDVMHALVVDARADCGGDGLGPLEPRRR